MLHRAILILCLLVASLITTATVHAREISGASLVECSGVIHSDGDGDQSSGDSDQAMPHHHGSCHGSAFVPARGIEPATVFAALAPHNMSNSVPLTRWTTGPDLRPPIV